MVSLEVLMRTLTKSLALASLAALALSGLYAQQAPAATKSFAGDGFLYVSPEKAQAAGIDAYSSATQAMDENEKGKLPPDKVKARILEFLKGSGDYREMYVLATSYQDRPVASAIELVLDPATMRFYATSERQTEKLFQIFANPEVSAVHVRQLSPEEIAAGKNYFSVSEGVQLFGKARLLKGGDSGFDEALRLYMPTLTRKPLDEATLERMRKSTIVIEIEPESLVLVDGALLRSGMNYKQIWKP
jgi:hypothetical protein